MLGGSTWKAVTVSFRGELGEMLERKLELKGLECCFER